MMIRRFARQDGDSGTIVLGCSVLAPLAELSDKYVVAVDAVGLDHKGDPLTFRLLMSRNEVRALTRFDERTKEG